MNTFEFDAAVLRSFDTSPRMTYVVRNILARGGRRPGLKTSQVLRSLRRLEARGLVKRVSSCYAVQLCWERVKTATPEPTP